MKRKWIIGIVAAIMLVGAVTAWAMSPFNDEYITGNWKFQNDVEFMTSLTLAGTTYTSLSLTTATDFDLTADADAGDYDIKSLDKLEFYDNAIYIDGGADATLQIVCDGSITIDGAEFDVSGTTGAITINDGGDAGNISIEGTVLDINSLDFVGAGAITAAASSAITINPNAGNAAGEDLIITAHNVQLTAAGKLTMSPDAAETLAIDLTSTNYTNAISVGDNAIVGTTGLIDYTNFDVNADGDVTCVDLTASGAVNVGTWKQDAIVPASAAPQTITIDGAGAGGVTIGATSTGTITLGDDVTVSDTYDVLIGEGKLTIDDDQNETALVITSDVTDGTSAQITSTVTTGKGLSIIADSLAGGTALYLDATEGAGFTGYYILAYDGTANDFAVKRHGEIEITGAAGDMLTITTGDIEMTAGNIDVNDGKIEINTDEDEFSYIERAQAAVTTPVLSLVEQTDTVASAKAVLFIDQDTDSAPSSAIEIDTEGAYVMKVDALVAAGDGIYVDVADSYTGQWFIADVGPWLGTTGEGFWSFTSDSAATQEVGQVIRINLQGTGTAGTAVEGKAFHAESQAAVKAGESLVYLDTLTNTALHIDNEGTAADGIKFDVADSYTGQGIVADLGPWLGTTNEGFIHITSDSAGTIPAGQFIRMYQQGTGQHAAAIAGTGLWLSDEAAAPAAGTSYLVYLDGNNIEAIHVDTGDVQIDDNLLVDTNATIAGVLYANGSITGDGATEMVGVRHDVVDAGATNPYTVTAAMSGTVFINSQAVEFDLPADPTGLEFTFVVANASNLHIDPNGTDQILHSTCAAGDRILSATVGDTVTLVGVSTGAWYVKAMYPAATDWTDAD